MPLELEDHGDVGRLRMHSVLTRAAGLDVSVYVVRGVMIDTGFHRARRELVPAIEALGVRGAIVTHWHEDHGGNIALLARRGMPMHMRPETEAIMRAVPSMRLYRRVIWGYPPTLTSALASFDAGAEGLECIHTPGHSEDHQVVWDAHTGTLFSGDLWLGVRSRILHAHEDPYMIVESLRTVLALEPARMFDAHRGAVVDPVRAIRNKIEWLGETLGEIERRVAEGWSDREVVDRVLHGEERAALVSRGEYSRRNMVKAVRRKVARALMVAGCLGAVAHRPAAAQASLPPSRPSFGWVSGGVGVASVGGVALSVAAVYVARWPVFTARADFSGKPFGNGVKDRAALVGWRIPAGRAFLSTSLGVATARTIHNCDGCSSQGSGPRTNALAFEARTYEIANPALGLSVYGVAGTSKIRYVAAVISLQLGLFKD